MDPLLVERILHPTDFSAQAGAALAYAMDLAVRAGAELHLLHVVSGHEDYAATTDLPVGAEEDLLVRLRETAVAHFSPFDHDALEALKIDYELAEGRHEAPAIVAHAARQRADVVVLGTHGRHGLRHLLLGSIAESVVRDAPCPVLVVRNPEEPESVRIKRIVVPVDFSVHAGPALAQAKYLAALYGATIALLFVAEEHVVPFFSDTGIPTFTLLKIDPDITARAEEALRQLDDQSGGPDVPVSYTVHTGQPAYEIVNFAEEQAADLLVMATRGLSGVEHGLLGSVTERVIRTAPCPVWTLHVDDAAPAGKAGQDAEGR